MSGFTPPLPLHDLMACTGNTLPSTETSKLTNFQAKYEIKLTKGTTFKSRTDVLLFLSQHLKTGRMNDVC